MHKGTNRIGARNPISAAFLFVVMIPCAANAAPVEREVRIGSVISSAYAAGGVAAAAFPDGGFVVVWNAPDALRAQLLDHDGAPIGGEIKLVRPAGQVVDAVATLLGGFVVVWDQANRYHNVGSVFGRTFDRGGAPLGPPFKVHPNSPYSRCCALVAGAPGGGFAVAWIDYWGSTSQITGYTAFVRRRFFDPSGRPLGPAPPKDPSGPPPYHIFEGASIDALSVGADGALREVFLLAGDQWDLYWNRSNQAGVGPGGGITPSAEDGSDGYYVDLGSAGAAILPSGGLIVAWQSSLACRPSQQPCTSSIFAQRFDDTGKPLGHAVKVNEQGYAQNGPGDHNLPVSPLPDGGFIALYNEVAMPPAPGTYDLGFLFARSFNADGTPRSAESRLSTESAGNELGRTIAVAPSGEALAVWIAGTPPSVYARLLRP
jgi:hypothetical protein